MDSSPSQCLVGSAFVQAESFGMVGGISGDSVQGQVGQEWTLQWSSPVCHCSETVKHIFWECQKDY